MTYDALRRGRWSEAEQVYHVTVVTAKRTPIFHDFALGRLLVTHLRAIDHTGASRTLAWVLMPDHLHWLFSLGAKTALPDVMRSLKGPSARSINALRNATGAVWQRAYHDHAVRAEEDLVATARYIVANPLRAGLVSDIGQYPFWDAAWL